MIWIMLHKPWDKDGDNPVDYNFIRTFLSKNFWILAEFLISVIIWDQLTHLV